MDHYFVSQCQETHLCSGAKNCGTNTKLTPTYLPGCYVPPGVGSADRPAMSCSSNSFNDTVQNVKSTSAEPADTISSGWHLPTSTTPIPIPETPIPREYIPEQHLLVPDQIEVLTDTEIPEYYLCEKCEMFIIPEVMCHCANCYTISCRWCFGVKQCCDNVIYDLSKIK